MINLDQFYLELTISVANIYKVIFDKVSWNGFLSLVGVAED